MEFTKIAPEEMARLRIILVNAFASTHYQSKMRTRSQDKELRDRLNTLYFQDNN